MDKATPPKAIYYAALVVAGFFPFAQMVTLSVILILPLLASFKVPETRVSRQTLFSYIGED